MFMRPCIAFLCQYMSNKMQLHTVYFVCKLLYRGADKSLASPGGKQVRKHVRDARDFNNIETRAIIKSPPPLQGKASKEIHAILTETLACFLPGRSKELSAPLYMFRVVSPLIITSTNNGIYSIWYWSTVVATCRHEWRC